MDELWLSLDDSFLLSSLFISAMYLHLMVLFFSEKPPIINPVPLDSCQVAEEKPWEGSERSLRSRDDEEVQASWAGVSEGQAQTGSLSVQQGEHCKLTSSVGFCFVVTHTQDYF